MSRIETIWAWSADDSARSVLAILPWVRNWTISRTPKARQTAVRQSWADVTRGLIAYAVMSVGGFLGMGEKYFAIPWRAFTMDTDNHRFVLDVDRDRLAAAPGFDRDHWPSMADETWALKIHTYYSTAPYWQ